MQYLYIYMLIFLVWTVPSVATIYENATDKHNTRWQILKGSLDATVDNVYDKEKKSRIIKLEGHGTKSSYRLMSKKGKPWHNETEKFLQWEMKYTEDFVIIVGLETRNGVRYLIYTPGMNDGHMQYGLGLASVGGLWHKYTRDLQKDLEYFEQYNTIYSVNSFVIRGSGSIDNVQMINETPLKEKKSVKKVRKKEVVKKREEPTRTKKEEPLIDRNVKNTFVKASKKLIKHKNKKSTTPIIDIKGANPLFLKKGENYVDPGAVAVDIKGEELVIISSESIDIYEEGKYSVIYIATDNEGNSAVDTRYVMVGNIANIEKEIKKEEEEERKSQERKAKETQRLEPPSDNNGYTAENRELEMAEWEKELALREKAIGRREHFPPDPTRIPGE